MRRVGQTFEANVSALRASVEALALRRGDTAATYTEGSDFDVLGIVAERDTTVLYTLEHLNTVVELAVWEACPLERARLLLSYCLPAITDAELLLWHKEIWVLAVGADGAASVFRDVPYRPSDMPSVVQYWGFNRDILVSDVTLNELGLKGDCITQAWILVPLPSLNSPRSQWPDYLQGLSQNEARQILLERESLMPIAVFTRGAEEMKAKYGQDIPLNDTLPRLRFFPPVAIDQSLVGPYELLLAGLSFLKEEFVEKRPEPVNLPRATRRRLEADAGALPEIRVIAFRRAAHDPEDPAGTRGPYDCHFLVGAHWRRANARMADQRPVFVRSYVKGDTTKPFKPPQQVIKVIKR